VVVVWVDKNTRDLQKSLPTFIVVQQPDEQWTNGDDSAIQRIKLVWDSSFSRSSDYSSERWWWGTKMLGIFENRRRLSM